MTIRQTVTRFVFSSLSGVLGCCYAAMGFYAAMGWGRKKGPRANMAKTIELKLKRVS